MNAFYDNAGFSISESPFRAQSDGLSVVRADRQPCPICGHPTGDCPGESGPPDVIFGYNTNSTLDEGLTFLIEEDIFDEREIAPGVVTKFLVHRKGTYIPLLKAKELGLIKNHIDSGPFQYFLLRYTHISYTTPDHGDF